MNARVHNPSQPITPGLASPSSQVVMGDITTAPKATANDPVPSTVTPFDPAEAVKTRKPFGGFQKKLDVLGTIPGYQLYWINDDGSRIPSCLQAGYQFVLQDEIGMEAGVLTNNRDLGDRVSRPVGSKADGSTMHAYLMKLPNEFVEQDARAHADRQATIDRAIKGGRGQVAGIGVPQDGSTYTPNVGVKIQEQVETNSGASPTGMTTTRVKTMG